MLQRSPLRRYIVYATNLLALFVIGWGFTAYDDVFLGLILGTTVSFLNMFYLYFRVERASKAAVHGKKAGSLGMLSRFALVGLAVLIVYQFPEYIHVGSMVIGISVVYVIIFIDSFIVNLLSR